MQLSYVHIEPRDKNLAYKHMWVSPILAILLTLAVGSVLFSALGKDLGEVFYSYFIEPVSSLYGLGELSLKATPLILIALGLSIGYRANVWNIGAEGQFIFGAIGASAVALYFYEQSAWYILPLALLTAILGGMLYAWIPAVLKTKWNTNEILTSLMLVYIAQLFVSYLVTGPLKDPEGYGFPQSRLFSDSALLPVIVEGTRAHWGTLLVLIGLPLLYFFLRHTFLGTQVMVVGYAPKAAKFLGFSQKRIVFFSFLLTGALAGIAGAFEVLGPAGQLTPSVSMGYGFAAIIVAFIGRLQPLGIFLAGLLMALFYLGAESAQLTLNLPLSISGIFQGLLLFFLLMSDFFVLYRISWRKPHV